MGTAAQRLANIFRQGTHIGSFTAPDGHAKRLTIDRHTRQFTDGDDASLAFDVLAFASVLVERPPLVLERREHGRHLFDVTHKALGHGGDVVSGASDRSLLEDVALTVACGRHDP